MTQSFTVDGILFDSDGVLVNSLEVAMGVWREWGKIWTPGFDPTVDFPHGTPARDIIAPWVSPEDHSAALQAIEEMEVAESHRMPEVPGAVAFTESLPAQRWVVVTSAGRELAVPRLANAGHNPTRMITAEDVTLGKPNPDPYLRGAELLGLEPSRVAVFEDAAVGVEAARAAGVGLVVGVGDKLDPASVDVLIPDLRHVRRLPADEGILLEFSPEPR